MSTPICLLETSALQVLDSRCRHARSGPGAERGDEPSHLALLRRGSFRYHLGRRSHLGDPCTALLHRAGSEYRIAHPGEEGDDATLIVLSPALADELFGSGAAESPELPLSAATQLHHARLCASFSGLPRDPLALEERTLELLQSVAAARTERPLRAGPSQRRVVGRARELLAAHLDSNLALGAVAAEAGCSVFHLMRLFRAQTGRSVRAYRRELRVLAALPRLAAGETDLARLAVELGFSHHSHLSQTFRSVLGISPRQLRSELRPRARS